MGRNSRERHKAKRKGAAAAQRRRSAGADDPLGLFGAPRAASQHQLAEQLINEAIHVRHRGGTTELDRCRAVLTVGLGGAAGIQVVNRALLTFLLRSVEQAWQRGWQPAELVRAARREHTARHGRLVVDAIAGQMRGYPAATVDQRWQSQLAALDVKVWWEHDDHYVTAWGERQGIDRAAVIDTMIEVLHLLVALPPIELSARRRATPGRPPSPRPPTWTNGCSTGSGRCWPRRSPPTSRRRPTRSRRRRRS